MQGYAIMLLVVFVFCFRILYMAPLVQTAAHTISLALVVVVASHYWAVWLLKALTNKGVLPKGKRVVITRCDSGYGTRLPLELDRRGFTVRGSINHVIYIYITAGDIRTVRYSHSYLAPAFNALQCKITYMKYPIHSVRLMSAPYCERRQTRTVLA